MRSATNRVLQRQALEELAAIFPEKLDGQRMFLDEPRENVAAVLAYLEQHDLITVRWFQEMSGPAVPVQVAITAKGIDFIADDGGLGAILGVVTVKLHDETVRDLLVRAIEEADEEKGVKARLIDQVRALPAEGLKEATMELGKAGLAATPAAIVWLRSAFGI